MTGIARATPISQTIVTARTAIASGAFGVSSAYWGLSNDGLVQSASIDDVAPLCAGSLDRSAVIDLLALGFVRDPHRTLFRGLHRIPPGHRLVLRDDAPRVERWYQLPPRAYPSAATDGRLVGAFWDAFVAAVAGGALCVKCEGAAPRPGHVIVVECGLPVIA